MLKLIVSDFDGTLLPYGQNALAPEVLGYIRAALDKNIAVAISSGRTYGELAPYFCDVSDRLWFICADGAYYGRGGRFFYEKQIDRAELERFFKLRESGFAAIFHGAEKNYSIGNVPCASPLAERASKIGDVKEKIFKVTSFGGNIELPEYSALRKHWDGGENKTAQFVNRFADKGAALSDLQVRLMITKFDTACLGDGGNDIAMMKNAKHAICIGNRSPELSAVCSLHFDSAEKALIELLK